jgi:hypothetical protein
MLWRAMTRDITACEKEAWNSYVCESSNVMDVKFLADAARSTLQTSRDVRISSLDRKHMMVCSTSSGRSTMVNGLHCTDKLTSEHACRVTKACTGTHARRGREERDHEGRSIKEEEGERNQMQGGERHEVGSDARFASGK